MSPQDEQTDTQERIVLIVPIQYVKVVKVALEGCGQLDRTSKITPESQEGGKSRRQSNSQEASISPSQDEDVDGIASSSRTRFESPSGPQFPSLEFDLDSGEYRSSSDVRQAPTLQFDEASGQYREPDNEQKFPVLQFHPETGEYKQPRDMHAFPKLPFDPVSGSYKDQRESEKHRALTFNVASGTYVEPSLSPQLHFDSESGEYRPEIKAEKSSQEENVSKQRMRISTIIRYDPRKDEHELKNTILQSLNLSHLFQHLSLDHSPSISRISAPTKPNPLRHALQKALQELSSTILTPLGLTRESLLSYFSDSYTVYSPMLLLPHTTFSNSPWKTLLSHHVSDSPTLHPLWQALARSVNATHVAINAPIPPTTNNEATQPKQENILRSPINLTPIYGDFGPRPTPASLSHPTRSDFESAFWVHTTQNGIQQTWAPLYTMFSRGNIKEKARILALARKTYDATKTNPRLSTANASDTTAVPNVSAIDLYAGIGYFAFSYRRAGLTPVLCWELNPWSVEGMRRGAQRNGWSVRVIGEGEEQSDASEEAEAKGKEEGEGEEKKKEEEKEKEEEEEEEEEKETGEKEADLIIFPTTNASAPTDLAHLHLHPPSLQISHANLGLLPTCTESWDTAVALVLGSFACSPLSLSIPPSPSSSSSGPPSHTQAQAQASTATIHVHENQPQSEIPQRTLELEQRFQKLVQEWSSARERDLVTERDAEVSPRRRSRGVTARVRIEHVERVKMYAPGIVHCVFDVGLHVSFGGGE